MNYSDIHLFEPTLSDNVSKGLWLDVLRQDWRCYHSSRYWDTSHLIERFLRSHGRIPGPLTRDMISDIPMAVAYWKIGNEFTRGLAYMNGAVFVIYRNNVVAEEILFVDEDTATNWAYPEHDWYIWKDELSAEARERLMAGSRRQRRKQAENNQETRADSLVRPVHEDRD